MTETLNKWYSRPLFLIIYYWAIFAVVGWFLPLDQIAAGWKRSEAWLAFSVSTALVLTLLHVWVFNAQGRVSRLKILRRVLSILVISSLSILIIHVLWP